MTQNCTIVGELPKGYGTVTYAWFPTNAACEKHGMPSFEGYLCLHHATDRYPETLIDDEDDEPMWEIYPVSAVEDCTVYV